MYRISDYEPFIHVVVLLDAITSYGLPHLVLAC